MNAINTMSLINRFRQALSSLDLAGARKLFFKLFYTLTLSLASSLVCTLTAQAQNQLQASAKTPDMPNLVATPATSFSSGLVYDWMFLNLQLIQQTPGFSPPLAARALVSVDVA